MTVSCLLLCKLGGVVLMRACVPADHHKRVTIMHKKNGVDITKKIHVGHHYAALTACAHGASMSGTKALGG